MHKNGDHGALSSWLATSEGMVSLAVRVFVWGLILAILFVLRSFFLLIFLTFVFSYIQARAVNRLKPYLSNRPLRVVLVALILLSGLAGVVAFMTPAVKQQALIFGNNYGTYLRALDNEALKLSKRYVFVSTLLPELKALRDNEGSPENALHRWDPDTSPAVAVAQSLLGKSEGGSGHEIVKHAADALRDVGTRLVSVVSAFLLSMLFSFLIVLDLPQLIRGVTTLAHTKLAFIYAEAADSISSFGRELGRAFEAQFIIAILNTFLTAMGLWLLGLTSKMALCSLVVFFCSFVPIAGVFISSVPICLIALQESGVGTMFLAIALITAIHLIETYILNPRIYGQHMHMNPVMVLIILTVGGKLFGIWGLILGVPLCTYFFKHAIQHKDEQGEVLLAR